jgi:hypothetical protein
VSLLFLICCVAVVLLFHLQMRKLVLDMVLSTDMDVHFALLKRFDDAVAAVPDLTTWTSPEQRSLMFQMLVHLADLANPSRPWHLALTWAEWVVTEFLGQVRCHVGLLGSTRHVTHCWIA